jgi:GntR family transcriptional regulator
MERPLKPIPAITLDQSLRSPRYAQVFTVLRDWILQGVYAPGSRLPSESELCDLFSVSRITVRSAVEMLEQEGMVQRIQGRGTYVNADMPTVPSRGDLSELVRRLRQLDSKSALADVVIREETVDDMTARDLQISPGEQVTHVSYVRTRDGEPLGVTEIYIPSSLKVALTEEDLHGPAPTLLQNKGFEILGAHQLIGAALADSQIASQLKIPVGSPVVRVRLLVLELTSRPIELLLAYYRADQYMHHVFLAASRPGAQTPGAPA